MYYLRAMEYEFVIEGDLPDLNTYINSERRNKFIAAKIKKDATEKCRLYAMQLPVLKEYQYNIEITWFRNKRKDSDNIYFGVKFIQDGVVKAGKLSNDGYKQIKNIHHNREVEMDESKYRTVVKFISVED